MDKKQKLIDALIKERDILVNLHNINPDEHNVAIDYLIRGTTKENPDKWELLDACVNDIETLYSDYDCN